MKVRMWVQCQKFQIVVFLIVGCFVLPTVFLKASYGSANAGTSVIPENLTEIFLEDDRSSSAHVYKRHPMTNIKTHIQNVMVNRHGPIGLSCSRLFKGEGFATARRFMQMTPVPALGDDDYIYLTKDCDAFKTLRGYITIPLTQEEYTFPIAYSVMADSDIYQVERLLRSVYMPQNFYCLHASFKRNPKTISALKTIASCFPNVFVASNEDSVRRGNIGVIRAEMNCMRDLIKYKWKYLITLRSRMLPIRTNAELVKILQVYEGRNDVETTGKRANSIWSSFRHILSWESNSSPLIFTTRSSPPYNVTIYEGDGHGVLSRAFVLYLLHTKVAKDLLEWFSDNMEPETFLWPTINHNPHLKAPGALTDYSDKAVSAVRVFRSDCQGIWKDKACSFGLADLPWLVQRPELFADNVDFKSEPVVYDCLEEHHFNRTIGGTAASFSTSYYKKLPFVKYP